MSEPVFEASAPSHELMVESAPDRALAIRKQDINIYTILLGISLLAILAGTLILFLELRRWGDFPGGSPWNTDAAKVAVIAEPAGWSPVAEFG